ncbi:MAG: P1 family peptidase [Paracoccaceae bacterium]|nr:P1 family peptidase [Paracoccaceae bacterium]
MPEAGPKNSITDVPGILVGNAEDAGLVTGVTAVVAEAPAVAACAVAGGAPGTRGTTVLDPASVMTHVDAVVMSGGSAFGLDAPGGALDWLRQSGRGFPIGGINVPIVPGAIIFDLLTGGPKDWDHPPWFDLGRQATANAGSDFALGNAGAGIGATAGALKGGLGAASVIDDALVVGAVVVVNSLGSVVMPGTHCFWAWPFERNREFGGAPPPHEAPADPAPAAEGQPGANTTLAVVATNAALDRDDARRVALMAQDGFARAIRPVHTPLDGDTVFVLATGAVPVTDKTASIARIGSHAADCVARAVARGVYEATPLAGFPAYRELT